MLNIIVIILVFFFILSLLLLISLCCEVVIALSFWFMWLVACIKWFLPNTRWMFCCLDCFFLQFFFSSLFVIVVAVLIFLPSFVYQFILFRFVQHVIQHPKSKTLITFTIFHSLFTIQDGEELLIWTYFEHIAFIYENVHHTLQHHS